MIAFWVDWLMVTEALPCPEIVAALPTTVPPSGPAATRATPSASSAVTVRKGQAWMHPQLPLQPRAQDEEEPRVLARAGLEQTGHRAGVEQARALHGLRHRQISGYCIQPSQAQPSSH